jgi:hypothetical protein
MALANDGPRTYVSESADKVTVDSMHAVARVKTVCGFHSVFLISNKEQLRSDLSESRAEWVSVQAVQPLAPPRRAPPPWWPPALRTLALDHKHRDRLAP